MGPIEVIIADINGVLAKCCHSDSGVSPALVLLTALGRHSHQPTFIEKSFKEHLLKGYTVYKQNHCDSNAR